MDFNLPEDDLGIDCMNFVDTSNTNIMREMCGDKIAYQEPPSTTANPSSISNMLIDEAPDNLLSSAAVERNIFSDDDEYGLQRLKKPDKNFEKPLWENDFNTDDVIKKESDLELDLVNFPLPPSAPPAMVDELSNSIIKTGTKKDTRDAATEIQTDDFDSDVEESDEDSNANDVVLYEVATDNKRDNEKDMSGESESKRLTPLDENERKEKYFLVLNDHDYISFTSFDSVIQYVRHNLTAAERTCLLDLLAAQINSRKSVQSRSPQSQDVNSEDDDDDDDDTASLATTKSFHASEGNRDSDEAMQEDGSSDEDIDSNVGTFKQSAGICKAELSINDIKEEMFQRNETPSSGSIHNDEETEIKKECVVHEDSERDENREPSLHPDDRAINCEHNTVCESEANVTDKLDEKIDNNSNDAHVANDTEKGACNNTAVDVPRPSDIKREPVEDLSEKNKGTEESSILSENCSEPNEYLESDELSSTDSDDDKKTIKSVSLKRSNSNASDTCNEEPQKNEEMNGQVASIDQPENSQISPIVSQVIEERHDNSVRVVIKNEDANEKHIENEHPTRKPEDDRLTELRTFANRLINFCDSPNDSENLDDALMKLLYDFRGILGKPKVDDKSMQTEKYYSKAKRKRMNEKAKRKLLDASSSSSDSFSCTSDEEDCSATNNLLSNILNKNTNEATADDDKDEAAGEEEKLEKSPSYSDLSGRASSEEYLNTIPDENIRAGSEGFELSIAPSEKASAHGDEIARSIKDEEQIGIDSYNVDDVNAMDVTENVNENNDIVETVAVIETDAVDELKKDVTNEIVNENVNVSADDLPKEDTIVEDKSPVSEVVDDEMKDVSKSDAGENDPVEVFCEVDPCNFVEDANDSDVDADKDDDMISIIENDEKLKSEPSVVIKKLSDEDLEQYFDELREKEIQKLLKYSGLIKRTISEGASTSGDKPPAVAKSKVTKKLLEILKESENDICSDESASDVEDGMTEQEFLKLCNENAKNDILKSSSSDSEVDGKNSEEEELDAIDVGAYSSSEDEAPSIVDKFLEKFSSNIEDDVDDDDKNPESNEKSEEAKIDEPMVEDVIKTTANESPAEQEPASNSDREKTASVHNEADFEFEDINFDSSDELSDDVELVNEQAVAKDDDSSTVPSAKPSTSRGLSIRNLLMVDKEIDIDAIEKEPIVVPGDDKQGANDVDKSLARKPTSTKSLETMIEESRRRQNAKGSTDTTVVNLDSDSDLEEVYNEQQPELRKRTIKPMLRKDQLAGETRTAQRRENERLKRLEKKNEMLSKAVDEHKNEMEVTSDENKQELILDYNTETKEFIKVHSDIVKYLKPHQFEGIKFMYDNTYGNVDSLKKHPGSGCILAHCMGLGKTLQIVALLHTVISHKELETSKILVLCPKSTVMNWADEIRRWLGPTKCAILKIFSFNDGSSTSIEDKIKILREWASSGKPGFRKAGCLLLGYEAFRLLVFNPLHKKRIVSQAQTDKIKQMIRKTLLDPGADLVICDEGHIIKNRKSATSSAVSELRTPRRIILTGTPIQNNLKEYYAMVNFIKPKFLGTEKEFANLYENPIRNGQHKDSNKRDIKIMKQRSFVLHKKLSKFVQRREAALLKTFLPAKFEYVLFIPMTEVQIKLYEYFLQESSKREGSKGKNLIPDYTCLRKIWTHPRVLENAWKNAVMKKRDTKKSPIREPNSDDEVPDDVYDTQTGALSVTDDWWRKLLTEENLMSILPSSKLQVMFEILRMCAEMGEKCLIFSAFVAVLDCVEFFMYQITKQGDRAREYGLLKFRGPWESGKDYYRLDGKTPKNIRHEMIKRFNDPNMEQARVFLISAKAGGQGINLIGANRVIILDTSWNPSNDQQNIFRVYRLGQKRQCYVYRLLAMGTMEEKVYSRSVTKQALSFRVADEQQIDRHYSMAELSELYTLTKPDYQNRPTPPLPQDNILASLLRNCPHLVYKYHEHDSLLENKLEQELSEQEKADAWDAYERDLQGSQNPDFLSMPNLHQNSPFLPPGLGYGFPQDRNYPMTYGAGLPPVWYSANSSLLDMLKMFPSSPNMGANGPTMNPQGNMMHPYGPGVMQSSGPTSSAHPMNLPPFSALQSMVSANTGVNSMPSYTSPYASMAGSYNMPADPSLLRLSQMYNSSLGVGDGGVGSSGIGNLPRMDGRSPPGLPTSNHRSAANPNDKRMSPFPTGLMPPSNVAESIPTSVIKPPQAHSASTSRQTMPPQSSHPLPSQSIGGSIPKPLGSNEVPSLQQQLMAQSRLPPPGLQSLLQTHMPTPRFSDLPPYTQTEMTSKPSANTNTTVASAVPSNVASMSTIGSNRNNSPITVSQSVSPQLKGAAAVNAHRANNMGIHYPPDNSTATITPILATNLSVTSSGASSPGNSISVRSVSSINNGSSGPKNTIPATIISKPATSVRLPEYQSPSNIEGYISNFLKPNNTNVPNSAISSNSAMIVSPVVMKPQNMPTVTKPTKPTEKPQPSSSSSRSSLLSHLRQTQIPPKPDKSGVNTTGPNVDKSAIQILGTNNVQLTKVQNTRSILSKSQVNPGKQSPITVSSKPRPAQHQVPSTGVPSSVITKGRPSTTGLTVVPINSNTGAASTNSNKSLSGSGMTTVPTLAPLSSKSNTVLAGPRTMVIGANRNATATAPNISKVSSTNIGASQIKITPRGQIPLNTAILKKITNKGARARPPQVTKTIQPVAVPTATTLPIGPAIKRPISMTNLPTSKQVRSPTNNSQISRQTSSMPSGQKPAILARSLSSLSGKLQKPNSTVNSLSSSNSSLNSLSNNKSSLSIRSIDAINKFASAGITISPGKSKGNPTGNQNVLENVINQGNSNVKSANNISTGNLNNLSNSVTLSKVVGPVARKRPAAHLLSNNAATTGTPKKPRVNPPPPVTDRNIAESLLRARANQGLTVSVKNPQGNQKTNKDGKVTDVVELD